MNFPFKNPIFLLSQILHFLFFLQGIIVPQSVQTASDYDTLVFKNCTAKTYQDSQYLEYLSSFFEELVAKSSQLKFYKTTTGDGDDDGGIGGTTGISGLFQCKGDLSSSDCHDCVTKLPDVSNALCCGSDWARVQLSGCYVYYETDGFRDDGENDQLLYKSCSDEKAPGEDDGFPKARDAAFAKAETGVVDGGGYYKGSSDEVVRVTAQCEGDLGDCGCGRCMSIAVEYAQDECGNSLKGQIYLEKCFLSYTYNSSAKSPPPHPDDGKHGDNSKTLAIAAGGAAAVCAVFVFLLLIKNTGNKNDDC